jgi:hypothetical protein
MRKITQVGFRPNRHIKPSFNYTSLTPTSHVFCVTLPPRVVLNPPLLNECLHAECAGSKIDLRKES